MSKGQGKLLTNKINQGMYTKNKSRYNSLPWMVIETCGSKLSFYLFFALSCAKMSRVYRALALTSNFQAENCFFHILMAALRRFSFCHITTQ